MRNIVRSAFIAVCIVALVAIIIASFSSVQRPQIAWTQQYTTQTGTVMEPDHSMFYYWMMYHVFLSRPQPSYHIHVYEAPHSYIQTYKYTPQPFQSGPTMKPIDASTPAPSYKSTGGFSGSSGGYKSGGGFSSGSSSKPSGGGYKSGGGFSSSSSSSSKSSGGFSGRRK